MSVRRLASQQPDSFAFSKESEKLVTFWMNKYPDGKKASAVIPMLWIAQKQEGWVSEPAIQLIANRLGMPRIRVYEVATFYTQFNLAPVGEHFIQVCGTTPCWLRGAGDIKKVCESKIGPKGHVTANGKLSWNEVECLGACANAPMVQISNADGDFYYEDLTEESFGTLVDKLNKGEAVEPGPQSARQASEPAGELTSLTDASLYDGSKAKKIKLPNSGGSTDKPTAEPSRFDPPAKSKAKPKTKVDRTPKTEPKPSDKKPENIEVGSEPNLLKAPLGDADDLKVLKGVGPKLEKTLNDLGVYHFSQIADWGPDEIAWVDQRLRFKGRIQREGWIEQAKTLMEAK